jgi:6-phosphogluconate dehydrogenase
MRLADIGMIGLAVMGENLVMNMESKGYVVAGYDIDSARVNDFRNGRAQGKHIDVFEDLDRFVKHLKRPRKVMMMIKAGRPVDEVIEKLIPLLEEGDVIIDGGNSHFLDTSRRTKYVESKGLLYIGTGVSGGEEGALLGPSIMPGGSVAAWPLVKPIFQAICAEVDGGAKCCDWVGEDGAGHFVKMVHNGIEYGDIQLISEAYHVLKEVLGMSADEMYAVFKKWNETELNSYLIEITADILAFKDHDGTPLIDRILDTAGQKGTGKWTANASLDSGVPLTLITEAVYARFLSSMKTERMEAAKVFPHESQAFAGDKAAFVASVRDALYAAKIISYAQGYALMRAAAKEYGWNLNYGGIALMWRGGCIIRSAFLGEIKVAFDRNPDLTNVLLDPFFASEIQSRTKPWRHVITTAIAHGIPTPAMSSALAYFDGYRTERLPANLLQAQRDYFGAHTYERVDQPRGVYHHTNWTGRGGTTASTTYNVK